MPSRRASKTYGTVEASRQKDMSGLEFVQGQVDGSLPLNSMAQTFGYDIAEAENGRVVVTAVPSGSHLNPARMVHGGVAATLLDTCMGLAVHSTLEKGVQSDHARVQDFAGAPHYAGHRADQGGRHRDDTGPPGRHRRGAADRRYGTLARAWHDDVPDISGVMPPLLRG